MIIGGDENETQLYILKRYIFVALKALNKFEQVRIFSFSSLLEKKCIYNDDKMETRLLLVLQCWDHGLSPGLVEVIVLGEAVEIL